jgi:hypothetical protein
MHTKAPQPRPRHCGRGGVALEERFETGDPEPLEPPYEDPDDPDVDPGEDDDFALPGEEDEYASPAVEPHEEPLVTP